MQPVDLDRVPDYFHTYIKLVKEQDLNKAFYQQQAELKSFLEGLPAEKWDYSYAPGKWTIKDIVQHIIDTERVFAYRALCFARGSKFEQPGFDENAFAGNAEAANRPVQDLLTELDVVQTSTALLFRSFTPEQLEKDGKANGRMHFVKGLGFIIIGHALHHIKIIKERYL